MTCRAVGRWVNVQLFTQLLAEQTLFFVGHGVAASLGTPSKVRDFVGWANVRIRIAMAFQAPGHRDWLNNLDNVHLVDAAVALDARYALRYVSTVIEVNEVRQIVHACPIDRFAGGQALSNWLQGDARRVDGSVLRRTARVRTAMAVAAGFGRRNCRMTGLFDRVVTVTAVHFQASCMQLMAEGDWLLWSIAPIENLG